MLASPPRWEFNQSAQQDESRIIAATGRDTHAHTYQHTLKCSYDACWFPPSTLLHR